MIFILNIIGWVLIAAAGILLWRNIHTPMPVSVMPRADELCPAKDLGVYILQPRLILLLALFFVGLVLVLQRHEASFETKTGIKEEKQRQDAADEIGEWLLKEGQKRLVVSDLKGASDAARLAAFFGGRVDEARAHLRAGKRVQAIASLLEAAQKDSDAGEARQLLDELEKSGTASLNSESSAKPTVENGSEALKNFKEGMRLKEKGDLIGAREKLELAHEALQKFSAKPPFFNAVLDARVELGKEIEKRYMPRIEEMSGKIIGFKNLTAGEKLRALLGMEGEIRGITAALPESESAARLAGLFGSLIGQAEKNWITAAQTAENFSGCKKAGPMYEEISAVLQGRDGEAVKIAAEGKERCGAGQ